MKKQFLFLTSLILLPTVTQTKIEGDFESVAYKPYPTKNKMFLLVRLVKTVNEIPQVKNISAEQKKQWDELARKVNQMTEADMKKMKEMQPLRDQVIKLSDSYYAKLKQLNQGIEQLLKDNPEFKKLKDQEKIIDQKAAPIFKQMALLQKKMAPIKEKQQALISKASQKKYASPNAWMIKLSPKQRNAFIKEIERTKEYQALEQQLKPFKPQQEQLTNKMKQLNAADLSKKMGALEDKIKQSKDFPASLKKLNDDIKQIKKKRDALRKQLRKREEEANFNTSEIVKAKLQLEDLFNKIKNT